MRRPTKLTLIKLFGVIFVLVVLFIIASFTLPKTELAERYLLNRVSTKFAVTFNDFNELFDKLPLRDAPFDNKYCNELRMRFLREGESDWVQFCTRSKTIDIKTDEVNNFPELLVRIEQRLKEDDWRYEPIGSLSKPVTQMAEPNADLSAYLSRYSKTSGSMECVIIFGYDSFTVDRVFKVYETCSYYVRDILDRF